MKKEDLDDLRHYLRNGNSQKALALLVVDKVDLLGREKMADGNVCGRDRAVYKDGEIVYEPDRTITHYEVQKAHETRVALKRFYDRVNYFCNSKENKTDADRLEIVKIVSEVKEWCLNNGFYGKALDFAKLLQAKFKIDGAETLEKAVRGYASRQIYRGDSQFPKVKFALTDAQFGRYGVVAKLRGRQYYMDIFNSTKISLPVKKSFGRRGFVAVGMDEYKRATSLSEIIGPNND